MTKLTKLLTVLLFSTILSLNASFLMANGISLAIENDVIMGTDNNYSHATEVKYSMVYPTSDFFLRSIGMRQSFYTPEDIADPVIHSYDRTYCGTAELFFQGWRRELDGSELVMYEIDIGVLGPLALGKETQSYAHKIMPGNSQPQGWENQMPNEPIFNFYMERHHSFFSFGDKEGLSIVTDGLYGGALGTTWINSFAGSEIRAGWNIPDFVADNTFAMKGIRKGTLKENSDFFAYIKIQTKQYANIWDSTLGDSLFQDHPYGRELLPTFNETSAGLVLGYSKLSVCILRTIRTREFEDQASNMDYGTIIVSYGTNF